MSSRQYLEDGLRLYGHVRIITNQGEHEAQISADAFNREPDYAKDLIDLIYQQVTGPSQFIQTIEPVSD